MTGRLIDDETGRPVSRAAIYVHAFPDASGASVTIAPDDENEFALRLPSRSFRLRVTDADREYGLWERTFTLDSDALDQEIRLEPLHWLRLHGRILEEIDGELRPLSRDDGSLGSSAIVEFFPAGYMHEDRSDSTYWVRVPRERIRVGCVNSPRAVATKEIDLTGATEPEREFDVILR